MTEADPLAAACISHLSPPDYEFATNRLGACGQHRHDQWPSGGGTGSGGRRPGALLLFLPAQLTVPSALLPQSKRAEARQSKAVQLPASYLKETFTFAR